MFYGHWIERLRLPLSGMDVQAELSSMTRNTKRSNPSAATATSHATPNSSGTTSCGQQVRRSIGGLNHKIRSQNPNHPVSQGTSSAAAASTICSSFATLVHVQRAKCDTTINRRRSCSAATIPTAADSNKL